MLGGKSACAYNVVKFNEYFLWLENVSRNISRNIFLFVTYLSKEVTRLKSVSKPVKGTESISGVVVSRNRATKIDIYLLTYWYISVVMHE